MSKTSAPRSYLAVTIDPEPAFWVLEETQVRDKVIHSSPIYHSWLRKRGDGIVGVRFSSWMINQGYLSRKDKDIVNEWNRSESDYEVYFGPGRDSDDEGDPGEEVRHTCLIKLDKELLAITLPLFGTALDKKEAAALGDLVAAWDAPSPDAPPTEDGVPGHPPAEAAA